MWDILDAQPENPIPTEINHLMRTPDAAELPEESRKAVITQFVECMHRLSTNFVYKDTFTTESVTKDPEAHTALCQRTHKRIYGPDAWYG